MSVLTLTEAWLGLAIFTLIYIAYDIVYRRYSKPRFRKGKDGHVEYKSLRFAPRWEKLTIWISEPEERICHIHDTIRRQEYDVKYIGPGRAYVQYDAEDVWRPIVAPYNTIKKLERYQDELIYKEDDILNGKTLQIVKD